MIQIKMNKLKNQQPATKTASTFVQLGLHFVFIFFATLIATMTLASTVYAAASDDAEIENKLDEQPPMPPPQQLLHQFWELDAEDKRGLYILRTFQPNYILPYHYTSKVNTRPHTPTLGAVGEEIAYKNQELKLQFSFRTKLLEDIFLPQADLWVAYTQTSLWQAWSNDLSRPFRSTDHNPDIFYVIPVSPRFDLIPGELGIKMIRIGLAHHSNGQSKPESRSWNYWHFSAAISLGPILLESTYKNRVKESYERDDNPDLVYYKGNIETRLTGLLGRTSLSLQRSSHYFSTHRGNWQLDVTYPLTRSRPDGVRIQLQLFSGYGETLLDYNHRQNRIGLGFLLLNI